MKIFLSSAAICCAIAAGAFFLNRLSTHEVLVAPAVEGPAVDTVTGTLKVFAARESILKSGALGRIKSVPVQAGETVEEGQLLVEFEAREAELNLASLELRLRSAKERLETGFHQVHDLANLRAELTKREKMAEFGEFPEADVERLRRDVEKLEILYAQDKINRVESIGVLEYQLENARTRIREMTRHAPFTGEISELFVGPGDYIFPGNHLVKIVSADRTIIMTLVEEDCAGAAVGQTASLRFASFPHQSFPATVHSIAPIANSDRKTRELTLEAKTLPAGLVPGLTGEAILIKSERQSATIIPRRALIGDQVFVVNSGKVEVRSVTPGFYGLLRAEILEGIEPGDLIILDGQADLREGQSVQVVQLEDR